MLTYKTNDGATVKGETPTDVVVSLRNQAWLRNRDLQTYAEKTCYYAELYSGVPIRSDSAQNMLTDLVQAGLLEALH
jgi:hypothetical protein